MTSHEDPAFRDGWGPGAFDAEQPSPYPAQSYRIAIDRERGARNLPPAQNVFIEDWRMGEYDDDQHEQRREHADDNRPNLLRRWLDRALGMGTPGEWASDWLATMTLAALFVCMFVFATIFGS